MASIEQNPGNNERLGTSELPTIESMDLVVDHAAPHRGILFQLPFDPRVDRLPQEPVEYNLRTRRISELVIAATAQRTKGIVNVIDPLLAERSAGDWMDRLRFKSRLLTIAHKIAKRKNQSPGASKLNYYSCSPLGEIDPFLGDEVFFGYDRDGQKIIAGSTKTRDLHINHRSALEQRLKLYGRHLEAVPVWLDTVVEGGNILATQHHIFTLRDTITNAQHYLRSFRGRKNVSVDDATAYVARGLGCSDGKRSLVVLDQRRVTDERQEIYHLDTAVAMLPHPQHGEVALVSSMTMAREILLSHGLAQTYRPDFLKKFMEANEYVVPTQTFIDSLVEETMETILSSDEPRFQQLKRDPFAISDASEILSQQLWEEYDLAREGLEEIGRRLDLFFRPSNLKSIESHLRTIKESLAQYGFKGNKIREIPALLWRNRELVPDMYGIPSRVEGVAPAYMPANGLVYNADRTQFLTGGGIRVLDDVVCERIRDLGVEPILMPEAMGIAYDTAGLHCLGKTIPRW